MAALIALGSILSYLLNRTAGRIGAASFAAFLASNLVDRGVYALLIRWPRWRR